MGPNNKLIDMETESQMVSGCEVTAILIIYGLPRLLTGYLLAHEMMHAWLRLNGFKNLKLELEEGLCQKGDDWSDFEKKLLEFCIHQIKEDDSPVYGDGFRQVYKMVSNHVNYKDTLKDIVSISKTTIPASKI
ncbi:unnamed protein product [Arabis nemorensis]|uniref:Protein DA1-like domain-containing protein n=1 Tax=Arabis nemorensis TaxID=586526 RepID=A0A565CX54_9BRAS|nr:unnamed protein product [Arabis nemorensis]